MKVTTACSLIISVGAIGLTAYVIAGPNAASGAGSQTDSDMFGMPVRVPTTHSGPAFNGPNQGNQSGGSSVANPSSSGNGSSNGSLSSNANTSSSGNTSSTQNSFSNLGLSGSSTAITLGKEKVIDTREKGKETQATATTNAVPETDKTFKPSILDVAVSDISNISHRTDTDRKASSEDAGSKAKDEARKTKTIHGKRTD